MSKWTANDIPDQTGRIFIITGANSGLGFESARALARKNAHIVMAVRNTQKGEAARDKILGEVQGAKLDLMTLDLSSLESVRSFADEFRSRYDRLDVLINNAGLMAIPRAETADGFEMQLGVNHLGHFALTGLLLDMLLATPDSRVVSVTSFASFMGRIKFDDIHLKNGYDRYQSYGQSKLANVLFARELQRRLEAAGATTCSIVAHPGFSHTNLQHNTVEQSGSVLERAVYGTMLPLMAQSGEMGALPQLYAATAPEAEGGAFYGPGLIVRGHPGKAKFPPRAKNAETMRRFWALSAELTGVEYAFTQPASV